MNVFLYYLGGCLELPRSLDTVHMYCSMFDWQKFRPEAGVNHAGHVAVLLEVRGLPRTLPITTRTPASNCWALRSEA